jgi:hypothetical protein
MRTRFFPINLTTGTSTGSLKINSQTLHTRYRYLSKKLSDEDTETITGKSLKHFLRD